MKNLGTYNLLKTFAKLFALTIIIGGFALKAFAAPPANDNFANAEVINGIQVHLLRTNVEATKEAGEPNHATNPGGKSVWFKWTAPMSRLMTVTTNRSLNNLDTLLHIYTGTALNNLSNVAGFSANDDIKYPSNARSLARFAAVQGTTYYIAVDGKLLNNQTAAGVFKLDIQPDFHLQGADYDGDGMTDFSYFRPSDGTWNIFNNSIQQTETAYWGGNGDIPVVSRILVEKNTIFSVFRPSTGIWYAKSTYYAYYSWGTAGDIPLSIEYSGSLTDDLAVFRPSDGFWYILTNFGNQKYYHFGQAGDIPVPGHYSPDAFADIAVFRPSNGTWYFTKRINSNQSSDTFSAVQFGQAGDKPVPADYDGDGILDVAVYRPSTGAWYVLQSSNNQVTGFLWGSAEDVPTTGDFDGDGKFDYAVFRPSNGVWYVYRSGDGAIQSKQFGQNGDIPVTANRTF